MESLMEIVDTSIAQVKLMGISSTQQKDHLHYHSRLENVYRKQV